MSAFKNLCLTAALTALTAPAWADLTYAAEGSYNLGSASGPGGTPGASTYCNSADEAAGKDVLDFTSSGVNSIGIHAYACNYGPFVSFGSRSSGENTYYARGAAGISGAYLIADDGTFSFEIAAGEVGAFGSTAFSAGEFQKSSLTIKLVIDGVTYLDEAWSAEVGAAGVITSSYTSSGPFSVGTTSTTGAGYFNYGLAGGFYDLALGAGSHDISYVMTSIAAGNITTTGVCTAALYDNRGGEAAAQRMAVAAVAEGPGAGEPFASYCGAGARSGDPFGDPIARAFDGTLPEPMSASLALTALLAAAGVRRRAKR